MMLLTPQDDSLVSMHGDTLFNFALLDEKLQGVEEHPSGGEEVATCSSDAGKEETFSSGLSGEEAGSFSTTCDDDGHSDSAELELPESFVEAEDIDTWGDVCRAVSAQAGALIDVISAQSGGDALNCIAGPRNEPTQNSLIAWSQHAAANNILKQFTLQGFAEKTNIMTIAEVREMFATVNLSAKWFVSKFKKIEHNRDASDIMNEILCSFCSRSIQDKLVMTFRDIYRLLEAVDLSRRSFVKLFSELDDDEFYAYDQFGRLQMFRDALPGHLQSRPPKVRIGNYFLEQKIGEGLQGGVVYRVANVQTTKNVALKWPVLKEELDVMKAIQRRVSTRSILPWPELLDSGFYDGRPYAVTTLLGADLSKVFGRLQNHSWERRWRAVRVFGRLLLRRLEVVHTCGYVHCDVSPLNILLGPTRKRSDTEGHAEKLELVPYLIDFGQAQKHPAGGKISGDRGSMEWSSINSANGGEPTPGDDLEALGWTLVYGLSGDLPWFEQLSKHYAKHSPPTKAPLAERLNVIQQVRESKLKLLDQGWQSLGADWWKLAVLPNELLQFLDLCRSQRLPQGRPGYAVLYGMLGGKPGLTEQEAELEDLRCYQADVVPLL